MCAYKDDLETLPGHLFRAEWQQAQTRKCIKTLTLDEACLCMDFAESYTCRFQGEVQSAFFDQNQVVLHPMMAYYKQTTDDGSLLVKHAIIGVTDDSHKDAFGVKAFEDAAVELIQRDMGRPPTHLHEFTDGCASQYEGKSAFYDISVSPSTVYVTRNFYETSHGKSVCDGLGAVVKGSFYQAVISGNEIICNATELFKYCEKKLQVPPPGKLVSTPDGSKHVIKKEFILVRKENIKRSRPTVNVVKGTRQFHSVRNTRQPLHLLTRQLSCYCDGCRADHPECDNSSYVDNWAEVTIKRADNTPCILLTLSNAII